MNNGRSNTYEVLEQPEGVAPFLRGLLIALAHVVLCSAGIIALDWSSGVNFPARFLLSRRLLLIWMCYSLLHLNLRSVLVERLVFLAVGCF